MQLASATGPLQRSPLLPPLPSQFFSGCTRVFSFVRSANCYELYCFYALRRLLAGVACWRPWRFDHYRIKSAEVMHSALMPETSSLTMPVHRLQAWKMWNARFSSDCLRLRR